MVTDAGSFGPRTVTNSTPWPISAFTKKMLDDLLLRYGIANRPEASVVAWPTVVGNAAVASNKVTLTLGSGCAEAVPPVWTTPLSEAGLADEIARLPIKIDAAGLVTSA